MISHHALCALLVCSAIVSACRRTDENSYVPPSVRAPAPYPNVENAAPLNNVEGRPEQARNTQALDREMTPVAKATLRPVEGRNAKGEAELEEVGDGVQVSLRLRQAGPGEPNVQLRDVECEDVAATAGPQKRADVEQRWTRALGGLEVGRDGRGELSARLPRAHLRPDQTGTLLGKSLVVYSERDAGSGALAIACGVVQAK